MAKNEGRGKDKKGRPRVIEFTVAGVGFYWGIRLSKVAGRKKKKSWDLFPGKKTGINCSNIRRKPRKAEVASLREGSEIGKGG